MLSYETAIKKITQNKFSMSISVKLKEGHLFLCEDTATLKSGNCYWIKLTERNSKQFEYEINYCRPKQIFFEEKVTGDCELIKNDIILSQTVWKHLMVRRNSKGIKLSFHNLTETVNLVKLNNAVLVYIFNDNSSKYYNKWVFHNCK